MAKNSLTSLRDCRLHKKFGALGDLVITDGGNVRREVHNRYTRGPKRFKFPRGNTLQLCDGKVYLRCKRKKDRYIKALLSAPSYRRIHFQMLVTHAYIAVNSQEF
jgi:hypothetical protein